MSSNLLNIPRIVGGRINTFYIISYHTAIGSTFTLEMVNACWPGDDGVPCRI